MVTVVHIDDAGFVRAPVARVYPVLTDMGAWESFWPRTVVAVLGDDRAGVRAGRWPRVLRLEVAAGEWRHDAGFVMSLDGDVSGTWEIWLEEVAGGTVVHDLVTGDARARWQPRALRTWIRRGLWGLKDVVEEQERRAMVAGTAADGEGAAPTTRGTVT